jgi:hypothetical protein
MQCFEVLYRTGVNPFPGFHGGMWYVYGAFLLISLVGFWIRTSFSIPRLALGTLVASLVFLHRNELWRLAQRLVWFTRLKD